MLWIPQDSELETAKTYTSKQNQINCTWSIQYTTLCCAIWYEQKQGTTSLTIFHQFFS